MRIAAVVGLVALAPASLAAPTPASVTLSISSCLGDARELVVPMRPGTPRRDEDDRCAKGCHAGCSRKRGGQRDR